ncbi:MAG TPA: T9SS type A sorting domain-containing protein [Bacteroidia bacterium]|nr:T9SS type A sorting domain-containing protein [Bacteroidia bacterium]
MKRILIIVIIFGLQCDLLSQGINSKGLFGYQSNAGGNFGNTWMDFQGTNHTFEYDSLETGVAATNTVICDSLGNLLFYTNGWEVADSTGYIMLNGANISTTTYQATIFPPGFGMDVPQANMAIPYPSSNGKYYLFHSTRDGPQYKYTYKLDYSIIDMAGNNGLGEVISKNNAIIVDTLNFGKIIACKHGNGRDWWVTCLQMNSNLIYKLLVTPYGINGPYSQSIGWVKARGYGECKFSPDGTKFAWFDADYTKPGHAEIMDFDRCSGTFSNPLHMEISQSNGFGGGVCFSPNSQLLYIANVDSVYQYDLNAANIEQSKVFIAAWDSFYSPYPPFGTYFYMTLNAPDGKIYISTGNSTKHLHVINNPDLLGIGCNLVQHAVALPNYYSNSLPNHPNYFLGDNGLCNNLGIPPAPYEGVKKIQVFGNPTHDKFTLWFPVDKDVGVLEIYDVNGECIRRERVAQWSQYKTVDISGLSEGVYFCRMSWPDGEGSVKVVRTTDGN